ncbi:hypothetical protein NDU88_001351 [Pleurodeles waltl]|uniref:Uncharacterized protein n=1 Tax=Pleurodeles waltl TaxID=8319 RepID=A0AAV7ML97_PLEWA|nr:hypothetical protein NDU88_001351 [Pleurodeles waltl]
MTKSKKALALLEQAGRMDIVQPEALGQLRPARRASAGVAASVMARLRRVKEVMVVSRRETRPASPCGKVLEWVRTPKGGGERPPGAGYMGERHNRDGGVVTEPGTVKQHAKGNIDWDRVHQAQERDPTVPISKKWPTIFQWSGSDEEGVSGVAVGQDGEDPPDSFAFKMPRRVYGTQADRQEGGVWEGPDDREGVGGDAGVIRGGV